MLLHLRELQAASCGWSVGFEGYVCIFPWLAPCITNSPTVGSVGPVPFQIHEQLTFKKKSLADPPAEVQSYLHGCILLTHSGEQRFDALHRCSVELTFRPFSNPNPLEEELRQPREVLLIPWRGADLPPWVPGWFTRGEFLSFSVLSSVTGGWLPCFTDVSLAGAVATPFDIWRWKMLD